ncbi:HNH endonuclease [Flavobacterium sp. CLA17]|uniref:HNH endonuclease n=1 Tax=Flavobacterium sp. CLA17 TaxID=2724135 RepID=UPI0014921355|nr:HNH endonuclease signature motif containing protein [Flavobacterium sp. CLA17]QSB24966.1 HNH endonuclease [Flavobacterium sp. CLA17]
MIKIERTPAPHFLDNERGIWRQEIKRAIEHYSSDAPGSFEFKLYNDSRVKDALKEIFVKCAYCESSYGAVYDGDVEHFRPKGRIKEKNPATPGYYWLANSWDNLFLACQHCNQRRKHILYGETDESGYGKLDQFPLDPEALRLQNHDSELESEEEARLLIDPCKDEPKEHFEYENTEAVIIPLTYKGRTSVQVYVLQRPFLVKERKIQMLRLFGQMECVSRELARLNRDTTDNEQQGIFEKELKRLMEYADAKAVYAGMCRFFIGKFLNENNLL